MNLSNKTIWITGASSGIGESLAVQLAAKANRIILSARREDELNRVKKRCEEAGGQAEILVLDLSNIDQAEQLCQQAYAAFNSLDVLINNGGISQRSIVLETSMESHRRIMEINYFSAVAISNAVLKQFDKQGGGQIVGISSIVGFFGFKLRCAYSASKHALKAYLESLRLEEGKNGIEVSIVYPGSIRTNLSKHAVNKDGVEYGVEDPRHVKGMSADDCARKIIRGMEKNRPEIFVGKKELLLVYIKRFFPRLFFKLAANIKAT